VSSRIHRVSWSREELFKFQPRLAEAYRKGELNMKDSYPIVSIVKGMTFVLVELENLEELQRVGVSGLGLSSEGLGLDDGWSRTFVAMYFFVRCGDGPGGEIQLRTRMIEGKSFLTYHACQPSSTLKHTHFPSSSLCTL
jgi:hypothetical protein